ncbi:hypothetical protein AB205_0204720 [Aquarana catesbeiana]|uniref:Uncharacterized protein n=1 Tax=Aquarana catesbeiana TaxID=8400 RepID=A0A2G9RFX5_AQUCT|nr:hypothetical protein AB205_0204720 [Aquarana catesbeiana]
MTPIVHREQSAAYCFWQLNRMAKEREYPVVANCSNCFTGEIILLSLRLSTAQCNHYLFVQKYLI